MNLRLSKKGLRVLKVMPRKVTSNRRRPPQLSQSSTLCASSVSGFGFHAKTPRRKEEPLAVNTAFQKFVLDGLSIKA
jgi:hypothetical protein